MRLLTVAKMCIELIREVCEARNVYKLGYVVVTRGDSGFKSFFLFLHFFVGVKLEWNLDAPLIVNDYS